MANVAGPQPDVQYCPKCGQPLRNVPRSELRSRGHVRRDGSVSAYTHTYECLSALCGERFVINQDR